jgi:hypothetical protein
MPVELSGRNIDTLDFASAQIATEVSVTATSSATGDTCITTGPFNIENGGTYYVEVYAPYLTIGSTNLDVELWDGATLISSMSGHMAASMARPGGSFGVRTRLATGGHNLTVKAFVDAGTGKFGANSGATGSAPNATLRVRST